ncbi:MAG: ribonuclease HII [Oligoflexales bacterium]|nr:ribonuclease HII [Oligoflexales bacterium]
MVKGEVEYHLLQKQQTLAGLDEVGRGCLAGPVYAAAVILDYDALVGLPAKVREKIRDSKKLSKKQRAEMISVIKEISQSWAVAFASVAEIEHLGIVGATFLAMRRSLKELSKPFDCLLIDGNRPLDGYDGEQKTIVKGDQLCYCIAAASILAKESRDQFMREQAETFPSYGFESHVGYGTKAHIEAVKKNGACSLHRRNFAPIRDFC